MFDLIHNHKTLVQIILGLIILPFAFWGIDSYQRSFSMAAQDLAEVAGQKITLQEFAQAQRDQQERLRSLLGRNFDPSLFDTLEQRAELLDQLIQQRLLAVQAVKSNLAVTDTAGPVTFHLRSRQDGEELRKVTGNSSLLRRQSADTEYEELTVDGVTLDGFFGIDAQEPVCLWIDVEGASGHVLRGATALLRRTELVLIEVEEKLMWEGQWRSIDVIEFFLDAGFIPLTRDAEYDQQYNIIFVREDVYERPDVLWSHELHTNYLTQHMGVR